VLTFGIAEYGDKVEPLFAAGYHPANVAPAFVGAMLGGAEIIIAPIVPVTV
jgi:hypothetical protein